MVDQGQVRLLLQVTSDLPMEAALIMEMEALVVLQTGRILVERAAAAGEVIQETQVMLDLMETQARPATVRLEETLVLRVQQAQQET